MTQITILDSFFHSKWRDPSQGHKCERTLLSVNRTRGNKAANFVFPSIFGPEIINLRMISFHLDKPYKNNGIEFSVKIERQMKSD